MTVVCPFSASSRLTFSMFRTLSIAGTVAALRCCVAVFVPIRRRQSAAPSRGRGEDIVMVLSVLTPYTLSSEHPGTVVAGAAPGADPSSPPGHGVTVDPALTRGKREFRRGADQVCHTRQLSLWVTSRKSAMMGLAMDSR